MKSTPTEIHMMNAKRDVNLAERRVQQRELSATAAEKSSHEEKAKLKRARKIAKQSKKTAKRAMKEVVQAKLKLEEARERLRKAEKKARKARQDNEEKPVPSAEHRAKPSPRKKETVQTGAKANTFMTRNRHAAPYRPSVTRSYTPSSGKMSGGPNKTRAVFEGKPVARPAAVPTSQSTPKPETKAPASHNISVEKAESSRKTPSAPKPDVGSE